MMTSVKTEFRGDVLEIILNRPEARNAVDLAFSQAFNAASKEAESGGARAVLIRAEGADFSVGGDLHEFERVGSRLPEHVAHLAGISHDSVKTFNRLNVPIIAAVQGAAAGGGLGFALCADVIIASTSARFRAAYSRIGLSPDLGISYKMPLRVGYGRAVDFCLTDRILSAPVALEWGLVAEVVEDPELLERARGEAARLAAEADAIGQTKQLLRRNLPGSLDEHLDEELATMTALAAAGAAAGEAQETR